MRYKKIMLIIIIFACLLAVLPVNATENVTNEVVGLDYNCNVNLMNDEHGIDVIADESMEETSRVDIYFDASKSDAGNGSKENPFNSYVGYGMIQSNANCHFKNGVYQVDFIDSVSNISFYGENPQDTVLDFQNRLIHLKGSVLVNNITFKQSSMYIYENISASNSIFKESYRTDFQPLIYLLGLDGHELLLDNCSFVNNCVNGEGLIKLIKTNAKISNCIFSDNFVETQGVISGDLSSLNISDTIFKNNRVNGSAGAIFIRGDAVVSNCSFINNSAFSGGAIFSYSRSYRIIVNDSRFYNNRALIGGALVSFRDDNIQLNNCDFINSSSLWGGTLALFGSHLDIFDCNFENSSADEGGVIYHRYGDLRVLNSTFRNNSGKDDAIILAFLIDGANFTGNDFIDNDGRAIVCDNKNISYQNNNLSDNDVYLNFIPNLFIGSGNYTLLKINDTFDGNLPEKYDPRDYDMVTPLRNQGSMGYCWAFGAMATLESCILKASGMKFDFSEMNLVNLLNEYLYGFHRYLDGGHHTEPISYFLSWFGPVDEKDDLYLYGKPVSPIFNSLFHVQNVLFVYMNNSTDWDSIKNAIYRYGAVKTDLLMNLSYFNGSAVYIPNTDTLDHTVSIVGWDDNFPKENFIATPPGDGAWIVKNSWGESIDDGYLYVSYYDAVVNGFLNSMYTFIFNDTIRLDKNYQYDFGDVMFTTSTDCIFHKNIFNSTDDEYLAAVGTYFGEVSDWDVVVNVNDVFVHSQSGRSGPGFFTINLDKYIPLKKNDKFEIIIKHYALEEGGRVSYPVIWYKFGECKGKSFFSYDDETWIDVSDNFNRPAVSAIKAYTFLNKINTTITLNADYNDYNPVNITVSVFDEYGNKVTSGKVIFDLAGEKYVVNVSKGIANIVHNFNRGSNLISAKFEGDGYESSSARQSIDILKIDVGASMNISTRLDAATINVSVSGYVVGNGVVRIGNRSYAVNLTNGFGSLIVGDLENGEYCAYFELENKTYECGVSKNFTVSFLRTKILAENLNTFVYSNEKYVISLTEEEVPISGMIICFKIDGREVMATTDSNGQAVMDVNLSDGTYSVEVIFNGDGEHVSCHADATITVNKFDSVISVSGSEIEYGEILHLTVSLNIDGDVELIFNNCTYSAKTNNKTAEFDVAGLDAGEYEFNIIFSGNEYYLENNLPGSVKVSKATPEVVVVVEDIEYGQYESITVKVNATGSVELSLGDVSFSGILSDGVAIFTMDDLSAGHYDVSVRYLGNDNYNENVAVSAFNVSKVTPGIIILVNDIVYGESCFVTAYIDAEGSVELSLGDICQTNVIENGEVSFTVDGLSAGRHDVSVRYLGGVNYNENAAVSTFYVSKIGSEVSVDVNDTFYGESVVIDVYVDAEGSVELTLGNIYQTKSVSDGKATFTLNNLSAGSYDVTVRYLGDINHSDKSSFACFNVNKIAPTLDKTYKNNMITVSLPQNAMGNVSLEIDNQIIIENVAGGVVNLQLPDLENGNYSYVISYSGDVNYLSVVMNDILNINKSEVITPEVIIPDLDSSDDGFVVVELPADATGTVTLSINGEDYVFAVNDGVSNVNLPELADGDYDYVITYSGDNKYSMFVKTGTMAVNNTQSNASGGNTSENITVEPEITIPPLDEPSDNGVVLITLPSDATGKVVLSIDGNDYDFVVENGVANVVVPNLANGDYSYTITYSGDAKYNSVASSGILKVNNSAVNPADNITDSNKTGNGTGGNSTNSNVTNTTGGNSSDINATKIIPEISVPSLNEPSGDGSVSVSLPVDATGTLTLTVNGKNYVFAIKDGVCNVELPELANGDYNYTITYSGDGKYSSVAVNGNFAVKKIVSTIIVASDVSVIYNDGYCLVATLKDSGNNAIVGAELFIDLNGVKTQLFSDDNGQVKMPLDGLVPKVYVAAITFEGNSEYEKSSKSVKITVMKAASQIVMGDLSGIAGEKLVISAEVISNNLTVDGGIVSFFDGETEIGSADVNNGGAELTYVPLKEGNYAITAVYGGNAVYKSSNSTVALKVFDYTNVVASNVKVTYAAGSYYTIRVYGTDGKLANCVKVVITVNGKTFKNLTATKGIAKFKVTNVPGTYKMNITSLGKSVTRTLTVKHLVTLKAITLKKSAKKLTLQATLAKVNGKYLKNKQITFKINGKKVATAKTNSKGVAKVTIKNPNVVKNLKVGKKATYQATYLKDTVKKTTKIKK